MFLKNKLQIYFISAFHVALFLSWSMLWISTCLIMWAHIILYTGSCEPLKLSLWAMSADECLILIRIHIFQEHASVSRGISKSVSSFRTLRKKTRFLSEQCQKQKKMVFFIYSSFLVLLLWMIFSYVLLQFTCIVLLLFFCFLHSRYSSLFSLETIAIQILRDVFVSSFVTTTWNCHN